MRKITPFPFLSLNLAITGCMGRMGQQFIKSAKSDKSFNLVSDLLQEIGII